jgi:hypothetical protein
MRYKDFYTELVNEITMKPRAFDKFIKSDVSAGIKCGFEAELYYPNMVRSSGYDDQQPNYDYDRPAKSIESVCDFFYDSDYNSRDVIQKLRNQLNNGYEDWLDNIISEQWIEQREELIKTKLIDDKLWILKDAITNALDDMGLSRTQIANAFAAKSNRDYAEQMGNEKQLELFQDDNDYKRYVEAEETAEQDLQDEVERSVRRQDHTYQTVYDEFTDDIRTGYEYDEEEYLKSLRIGYMSDVPNVFQYISWGYYTEESDDVDRETGFSEAAAEELAEELKKYIPDLLIDGKSEPIIVKVSDRYKTIPRHYDGMTPNLWIIEPDASLDERNRDSDMGAEIIAPPIPIDQLERVLTQFWKFARAHRAYSHESTGFHINVSMPNITTSNIDYLKLALLLGDEYVAKQFDRFEEEASTYCRNSLGKIKSEYRLMNIPEMLVKLKDDLENSAAQAILRTKHGAEKKSSIHLKQNYIEFRSPGGEDYFSSDPKSFTESLKKITNTAKRFAYATYVASQPQLERNEYAKKLTALLTSLSTGRKPTVKYYDPKLPDNAKQPTVFVDKPQPGFKQVVIPISSDYDKDLVNIFTRFAVGELPRAALKSFVKQAQLTRSLEPLHRPFSKSAGTQTQPTNEYYWWKVESTSKQHAIEVVAKNKAEAIKTAAEEWGVTTEHEMIVGATAQPLRKYEELTATHPASYYSAIIPAHDETGNWEVFNRISNHSLYRFNADNYDDAAQISRSWARRNNITPDVASEFSIRQVSQQN